MQRIQLLRALGVGHSQEPQISLFRGSLIRLNVSAATIGDPSAANIELEVNSALPTTFDFVTKARSTLFAVMAESPPLLEEAWRNAALRRESIFDH